MTRLRIVVLMAVLPLMGCAKLAHMQELLTLKAMSDEGDRQKKFIQAQDAKFVALVKKVKSNRLGADFDKARFLRSFGDPVFIERLEQDGVVLEQWLYRYSMDFFGSEKVYVRFDKNGKMTSWEYFPAPVKDEEPDGDQS